MSVGGKFRKSPNNGDIEAFVSAIDPGMSPEKLQADPVGVMAKLSDKALKNYPAPGEAAKYKKRWPQSSNREVPASIEPDDQAMDDLEALFGDETPDVEAPDEQAMDEAMEETVDVEVEAEEGDVEAAIEAEVEEAAEEAAESDD